MNTMSVLFASSNRHKLEEMRAILKTVGIEVLGLDAVQETIAEPVEDGKTFEANARIKAICYARATGRTCLADDSGLVVDALDAAPGVHSARYAADVVGETTFAAMSRAERDNANNDKLLRALKDIPDEKRTARFVCVMTLAAPDGRIIAETRGTFEGVIAHQPLGKNGFGYDPLLYLPEDGCTSAELPPHDKNARSHRGEAARKMAHCLQSINAPADPRSSS